jgi:hypothetical protein
MSKSVALAVWQSAIESGALDLARDGMGLLELEITERTSQIPEGMPGAFIPLIGPSESVQLGLVSSPEGCRLLAQALLQDPGAGALSSSDVSDAMGEASNILAGFVKRAMQDHVNPIQLGLPLFVNGHLETSDRVRAAVTHIQVGTIRAALVVLRAAEWKAVSRAA